MMHTATDLSSLLPAHGALIIDRSRAWHRDDLVCKTLIDLVGTDEPATTVVLMIRDPLVLARALINLDGKVARLCLLPSDLSPETAKGLITALGPARLLTDMPNHLSAGMPTVILDQMVQSSGRGCGQDPGPRQTTEWIFATSGTTGSPKLVTHTLQSLLRTVKPAKHELIWGQTFDLARFAGIQVFLSALLSGKIIIVPADWSLADRILHFEEHGCSAISATPTLWRKILMTPGHERLRLSQVTLGGEIADQAILQQLAATYQGARITHIYASTEAGTAFSVHDSKPGFPAAYLRSQGGIDMKIGKDGHLLVRTRAGLMRYVNDRTIFADTDGFVDTGDLVRLEGDRYLFVGRANGSINIGGNKLHPQEVEAVLLGSPQVAAVRIFAKPNPITGQIVVAEIVPSNPGEDVILFKQMLRQLCAARLKRWQVPAVFSIVTDLSMTAGQKLARSS